MEARGPAAYVAEFVCTSPLGLSMGLVLGSESLHVPGPRAGVPG